MGAPSVLLVIFQLLGLVGSGEGIDDLVDVAVHDGVDLIKGQTHPVVGDTALGEIVGADPFVAHTGTHLAFPQTGVLGGNPLLFNFVELAGQHPHTFFPVLQLAALLLAGHHDTGGLVDEANGSDAARSLGVEKLYISAHSSKESQAAYRALGCVLAQEVDAKRAANEPCDVQMEYDLQEVGEHE